MTLLNTVERSFSLAGSLLVIGSLTFPFVLAYLVSVYENRLLCYFSEGKELLSKGQIIGSVLSSGCVPLFFLSFGLLGLAKLSDVLGFTQDTNASPFESLSYTLIAFVFAALCSVFFTVLLHLRLLRSKLQDDLALHKLFRRWLIALNVTAQLFIQILFWATLWIFPNLVNLQVT